MRYTNPRLPYLTLPVSIHESQSLSTIKCHLKTFYFVHLLPFSCPPCLEYLHPCALILLRLALYKLISKTEHQFNTLV